MSYFIPGRLSEFFISFRIIDFVILIEFSSSSRKLSYFCYLQKIDGVL